MKIDNFVLENWLNPACESEKNRIYLGGSCVQPLTVQELFDLTGESMEGFLEELKHMSLGYGYFAGTPRTTAAVAKLYKTVSAADVILVHGGTGANNTVVCTLLEPGDRIVSVMPNYQQFHSIPRSIGVNVCDVNLKPELGYKLNMDELRAAVSPGTKAILFTNPNNPTGALMQPEEMREIAEIAASVGAWVVCDEMYRGLRGEMPSFVDIYEKTIVTASSSKVYSMAGTRVGWIVCKDPSLRRELCNRRSYDSICGGTFDEWIFGIALEHADKIFARSRAIVEDSKRVIDAWLTGHKYLRQYADSYSTTYLVHYLLDIPAEEFCNRMLDEKGVLVCHGDCFYIPHSFRICLSAPKNLAEGLRLIDEFLDELVAEGVPVLPAD